MRLHHLTVTAFGPFAGTAAVDFEELNDAGVFLVTGPTGAGKTSLLDAVCFALYGVVPGVRDVKTLRSHHAAPRTGPEVVVEATISDRRFRITRSPEWHRPKKRGEGTTKENARATLVELVDGTERLVSSRAQEVGHELGHLLGMSSDQFMQVVLLPQGEFQRFLRATSDQRQEVLQRLFGTHRFEHIEAWVRDRSRDLGLTAEQGGRRVGRLLSTLAHRSGTALPEALAADPLGDVVDAARRWAGEVGVAVEQARQDAVDRDAAAQQALLEAEALVAETTRRTAAADRRAAAHGQLARLRATEEDAVADAARLQAHDRALPVQVQLEPLQELRTGSERAARAVDAASEAAAGDPAVLHHLAEDGGTAGHAEPWGSSGPACRRTRDALVDRLARLKAAAPHERAAAAAAEQLARVQAELGELDGDARAVDERAGALPAELAEVEARLAQLRVAAAQEPSAAAEVQRATEQHRAATALPAARHSHAALVDRWRDARDAAADARGRHLLLVERRLAGIAAELAGQLAEGQPCQVCGSRDHPEPALSAGGAVSEEDQAAAAEAAERSREAADALSREVQGSAQRLAELEQRAGGSPGTAGDALVAARDAWQRAQAAVAALPALERELALLQDEARAFAERRQRLHGDRGALTAEAAAATARLAEARAELRAVVGDEEEVLTRLLEQHERGLALLERLIERLEERDRLADRLAEAMARAEKAAADQGFASVDDAAAALLPAPEATRLRDAAQAREADRRRAEEVLADAEVRWLESLEATGTEFVAPAAAAAALEAARGEAREATAAAGRCAEAAGAVRQLVDELHDALAGWEPARRRHATAKAVAELVRGRGADNQLQMRLSSYVLATRLDQVLDAANARLCEMRDQRYTLRRTGATRGNARAGLGIEVLDAWTGESRAPTTLSGGETFVVSLALALGLADVVGHETGGLRVDTLFVDEGFGSLDPDTLDDVMDRLDALRTGGRTVGVVSHVSELRTRIPVQVHVASGRHGSSVAVRTLMA